jgi:tetratricopeptide (TPR) repeat protein
MASVSARSWIEVEVSRIRELSKAGRHAEAVAAAEALVDAAPDSRDALYLLAANQRCLSRIPEALATLQRVEQRHPNFSLLYQERGHCYTALRDAPRAIDAFRKAVDLNPALTPSWMMLERLYRMTGELQNATIVAERVRVLQHLPSEVVKAGSLFSDGVPSAAESILRSYLLEHRHVEALRLLARIQHQQNVLQEAEDLLEEALQLAPDDRAAHLDYVRVLLDRQKYLQAQKMIEARSRPGKDDSHYDSLYAAACAGLGQYEPAIARYRQLLAGPTGAPDLLMALGHCLKSVGRQSEAIESYCAAGAARPGFGDAYWSLANLKTYRFSEDEIECMRTEEARAAARPVDRYHFCFALGRAYEDRNEYAESWEFYKRGNSLKRAEVRYDPAIIETDARRLIQVCTEEFFAARAGVGAASPDPIFIVGLPRSGSTLLEQILASHPRVEGTRELSQVQQIVLEMRDRRSHVDGADDAHLLAALAPEKFSRLGERYIAETLAYRTGKSFFIDKMPNNFRHIGLIHLMLPNAKIIDARREPMACCFSNLKQLFAGGQEFTYSIEDIARYYRTYLDLMRHWDHVLPGQVLRVCYEDVVEDLETSIRRILEFCGLEFEPACIDFHQTRRSVATASSEQVRQPIFREGLSQWRNYQRWLGRLREDLGDALIRYRE